jgi:hypothetical protein
VLPLGISGMYKQCLSYRSAFKRPGRHPNPFDEKGPVWDWFWDRNLIGMNQKPVSNCPGLRPGQFRIGCWSIRIRFRSPKPTENRPLFIKGVGVSLFGLFARFASRVMSAATWNSSCNMALNSSMTAAGKQ